MGETKVPAQPRRVIVLDTDKLDTMVSLGMSPVGAAQATESQKWPAYLGSALSATKPVGTLQQPNLEAIMALKPDLILGTKFRQAAFYDKLSKIAPTVFTEKVGVTWKENFLLDADALGHRDKAQDLLNSYEQRARTVGAKFAKQKVSIVRFMPTEIRMYGPQSFSGIVLGDAGIQRPQPQLLETQADRRFGKLSQENIAQADGDAIFYSAYGDAAAKSQAAVTGGPLWKNLTAVKSGNAHNVDDEVWMLGIGVTAAGRILDDLEKYLQ
ncbi:ABC transporter substrate-binding protein [Nonomuraea sp. NPDC050536]|uniref:ABC transporter substrate-binding protein n=1 Tax=Nonomuraea sp. NPDC050536 TaxID=3364366 RepID=UPI0037C504D6